MPALFEGGRGLQYSRLLGGMLFPYGLVTVFWGVYFSAERRGYDWVETCGKLENALVVRTSPQKPRAAALVVTCCHFMFRLVFYPIQNMQNVLTFMDLTVRLFNIILRMWFDTMLLLVYDDR